MIFRDFERLLLHILNREPDFSIVYQHTLYVVHTVERYLSSIIYLMLKNVCCGRDKANFKNVDFQISFQELSEFLQW